MKMIEASRYAFMELLSVLINSFVGKSSSVW